MHGTGARVSRVQGLYRRFLFIVPSPGNGSHGKAKSVGGTEVRRLDWKALRRSGQVLHSVDSS